MNQTHHVKQTSPDVGFLQQLFYEWFVRYNPLYFVSAACFIFGVFLVSQGMHAINWIDGQVALTGVIEFCQLLLLAGSFILLRLVSQTRPAVMWRDKLDADSKTMLLRISKAAWMIWAGFFLFHLISWIRFFAIDINLANVAPIFIILAFVSKKEEASWAGCILTVTLSSANPSFFWLTALLAGAVLYLNAWKNRQPRLYIGVILCFHFALTTLARKGGRFPDPAPWLPVLTGMGLTFIGWTFRLISAFCIVGLGVLVFWNPRGPRDIMEWGSLFIAIGFASLIAGIIANWKAGGDKCHECGRKFI